jgi:hypothetical protein
MEALRIGRIGLRPKVRMQQMVCPVVSSGQFGIVFFRA